MRTKPSSGLDMKITDTWIPSVRPEMKTGRRWMGPNTGVTSDTRLVIWGGARVKYEPRFMPELSV